MSAFLDVTIDHLHCCRNGVPFYPVIQDHADQIEEWSSAVVVRLPAAPKDELDWALLIDRAEELVKAGKLILWELDFGLGSGWIDLSNQTAFFSMTVAIEQFTSQVLAKFGPQTFGVILYRGADDWSERIIGIKEKFNEEASGNANPWQLDCYSAEVFAQYVHRLVSFLPDQISPFALVKANSSLPNSRHALVFSRRRFEHVFLALQGVDLTPFSWQKGASTGGWIGSIREKGQIKGAASRAVCLPQDDFCDDKVLDLLEKILQIDPSCRIICEERLTEEWNEVEQLIVFDGSVTALGRRMMQGFVAAGGEILDVNEFINLKDF